MGKNFYLSVIIYFICYSALYSQNNDIEIAKEYQRIEN